MTPDITAIDARICTRCGHVAYQHREIAELRRNVRCGCELCDCPQFVDRIDPDPPSKAGWDDGDDEGGPV